MPLVMRFDSNARAQGSGWPAMGGARLCPGPRAGPQARRQLAALPACLVVLVGLLGFACPPAWAEGSAAPATQPVDQRMGLALGHGLTLGGWGTLQLEAPTRSAPALTDLGGATESGNQQAQFPDAQVASHPRVALSDLSGMLWWDASPGLKALAEVDSRYALQMPSRGQDPDAPYLALERLYLDYRWNDSVSIRAGKFLTPVGRWNQDHADPLTWTTMRPLISQSAFPTHTTGLLVSGRLGVGAQDLDYQLFAAGRQDWRTDPADDRFQRASGLRLVLPVGDKLQLGASVADFRQQSFFGDNSHLVGADFRWSSSGLQIDGEAIVRQGAAASDSGDRGWFLQGVFPLVPRWYLSSRIEAYKRRQDNAATRSALVGVVYRSGRFWVFKAEWVQPDGRPPGVPQGLLASLTLLF